MNICQFRNSVGLLPCDSHLYTDINYNNNLNLWLCYQHEKEILKNHLKNFVNNRLIYKNNNYHTFSDEIRNRILNPNFNIPELLEYSQCLFIFHIQDISYTYNINIYNERVYATILHFKIPKYIYNLNNYQQLGLATINELDLYITIDSYIDPDLDIESELYYENNIENVMFNRHYNNFISNNIIEQNNTNYINKHFERLLLTDINECNICCCNYNELQIGFEMICCNKNIKVCVICIVSEFIINELKYKSAFDIKNFNFIKNKLKCSFCRKENDYIEILYNTYTQKICIDVLKKKCMEECEQKIQRHCVNIVFDL
jgi:hypothetical protein